MTATIGRVTGTGGAGAVNTILGSDIDRNYAIISNNSARECYLGIGTNALVGWGIPLNGKGSVYAKYEINDINYNTVAIKAAGSGGDIDLAYQTW
jgi:hypothetical protein